jgi:hypothetical protein
VSNSGTAKKIFNFFYQPHAKEYKKRLPAKPTVFEFIYNQNSITLGTNRFVHRF